MIIEKEIVLSRIFLLIASLNKQNDLLIKGKIKADLINIQRYAPNF